MLTNPLNFIVPEGHLSHIKSQTQSNLHTRTYSTASETNKLDTNLSSGFHSISSNRNGKKILF